MKRVDFQYDVRSNAFQHVLAPRSNFSGDAQLIGALLGQPLEPVREVWARVSGRDEVTQKAAPQWGKQDKFQFPACPHSSHPRRIPLVGGESLSWRGKSSVVWMGAGGLLSVL